MPKRKKINEDEAFREALRMVAPGSRIREAVSSILQSKMGALLCFGNVGQLTRFSEGGVKLDAEMTPQLVYELSKMDGAIILNKDGTRIHFANRFLKPASHYPTIETGTRHRAAQRFANQSKSIVLALSERRSSVTLYCHTKRYAQENIETLVNKGTQTLQTLEKYVGTLRKTMKELTQREMENIVTIFDVCRVLQRTEMVNRIRLEVDPILLELGSEGRLLQLQMQETLKPLEEAHMVVRDYYKERQGVTPDSIHARIAALSQEELVNLGYISQHLGYGPNLRSVDAYMAPRGYRILHSINRLPSQIIDNLVENLASLQAIMAANREQLVEIEGVGDVMAERIRGGLSLLATQLGK
ncbi:MAG: DNA integrity scanning diadenylate cyclase DisA [Candidatus Hydrogenedentes bacterium]|nr:DNA integrity scanning diadenylate cyclase DisA [Candidatus Hydrogenedentota bacterium]